MGKLGEACCCCCYKYDSRQKTLKDPSCPPPIVEANIRHSSGFVQGTKTGKKLFIQTWEPEYADSVIGCIYSCHGYGDHGSFLMAMLANRFAAKGYAVFSIDYIGHGRSEGVHCQLPDLQIVAAETADYFLSEKSKYPGKAGFLLGVSMGGTVAIMIAEQHPTAFDGMILSSPMCKIAPERMPSPCMVKILTSLANCFPSWPAVPSEDLDDLVMTDPEFKKMAKSDGLLYRGNPRLGSALSLLNATIHAENVAPKITLPYFINHGGGDVVTAPSASELFHKASGSTDKTLKIYPDMCHGLMIGDKDKAAMEQVWVDLWAWLDSHNPNAHLAQPTTAPTASDAPATTTTPPVSLAMD
eukprot:TRINITY_DN60506_c0_g1_i1.p1 TRINITY_DN60506_c0_g1~~TRINITY_DN60506_c0_g1_i1.p1  ORF type:complete len:356 (-),score=29.59 TRINITY_DN60506_c0_g1_i1:779-1846(-)